MKIQNLAVIFAIIILPMVIIFSYYIHKEIDTIVLQTSYDTKLIDSTHDAMAAFEINTANENLSSVSDSLRSIIEASTNVFFNTLATNFGMSNIGKSTIEPYVPAILYTLYDGYYIYAPTRTPEVLTYNEDDIIYVGDRGVTFNSTMDDGTEKIGIYSFNKDEYKKEKDGTTAESKVEKEARQELLYSQLQTNNVEYEFGQMLFLNKDNTTYSTRLHNGNADPNKDTKYKQEHVLKSYMPYSARYTNTKVDVVINYTLDNYITIEGNIDGVYYSKTGYLSSSGLIESISGIDNILEYNEIAAEELILSGKYGITLQINPFMENGKRAKEDGGEAIQIAYTPILDDEGNPLSYSQINERLTKLYENQDTNIAFIQNYETSLANLQAICYYVKSHIFSEWVYNNLGGEPGNTSATTLLAKNISDKFIKDTANTAYSIENKEYSLYNQFEDDETIIFDKNKNPELDDSPFASHKYNVIRNNIQYNLNLSISAYNEMLEASNVVMPVIDDSDWDNILTKVSVVSFLQGLNCGIKTYNNYAIASSTNNELTVIPTEIYYTSPIEFNTADTSHEYHKIDCDKLNNLDNYISFRSKEVKYDKIYNKPSGRYLYDHRNLGCYTCAISNNYKKTIAKSGATEIKGYSDDIKISLLDPKKRKAYYVALGKERQSIYKTNALTDSNGYEIYFNDNNPTDKEFTTSRILISGTSTLKVKDIRAIEITLKDLKCDDPNQAKVGFKVYINNKAINYDISLNLGQSVPQTMVIPVNINNISDYSGISDSNIGPIALEKQNVDAKVNAKILNVRLIYE